MVGKKNGEDADAEDGLDDGLHDAGPHYLGHRERLRARFNSLCELEKNARRAAENDEKLKDPDSLRQK